MRLPKSLRIGLAAFGVAGIFGCGGPGVVPASAPQESTFAGTVTAGQQAVAGSQVQIHVVVPSNIGSARAYDKAGSTDIDGGFKLSEAISCPSADSVVYLEATGGKTSGFATSNPAIDLITVLGTCGALASRSGVVINETTTVGALWPLSAYMLPATASGTAQALSQAMVTAYKLVNPANGSTPGALTEGEIAPVEKINSLGGILAGCIASAGGTAGDGSPCGSLFAAVAAQSGTAPHDTLTAALQIARNPGWNVDGIFRLLPSKDSSEPVLGIAPPDWTLPILTRPSAPVFLPTGGTLTQGQTVVISDETPDAAIYYTLDGSLPTANSSRYAGPITISASTTVTAAAIRQSIQSALAAATFSVALPVTLALTPSVVTLSASQSELFHATVGGASQTAVTYSLLPAVGTVSSAGLYTAPAVVNAAASVTLTAQTTDGSAKTAKAVINVIPGSLQLTIADTFLAAGSTQTATVTLSQPAPPAGSVVTLGSSDNSVAGVPTTVTVAAGKTQVGFTVAGQQQGHATVTATAAGFGTANGTLSVNAASIPKQFMGLNVGDTPNRWPTLQFGTLATNSRIQWPETNSGPGIYNFSMLDQYFQFAQHYGADIVFPLLDTPTWASSSPTTHGKDGPGECAPPSSMAQWDNYVRAVATYAGTNVKYWTVFNEVQDPGYWCGDVATLVMMVQHARSIIRLINPKAVMLSPTTTSLPDGPAMLAKFLAAGGGQYVDVIAFHGYKSATAEDVLQVISAYKQVLATAHVNLPVWDTEADWAGDGSHSIADPAAQGAFVAKYFLLHWSQGVSRFIWYEYDGGPWGGLVDDADGYKETLAATAYGETYKWLVGASMNNVCTKASNGTWSCGLARAGGYIATVMWNSTQDTHTTVPSGSVLSRDLTGVEHSVTAGSGFVVGNQPVLFENKTLPK